MAAVPSGTIPMTPSQLWKTSPAAMIASPKTTLTVLSTDPIFAFISSTSFSLERAMPGDDVPYFSRAPETQAVTPAIRRFRQLLW